MYLWSCKTLVIIYWTHLRVNGIWAKSFSAQRKWITECCSLRDAFSGSVAIFIVDKWCHSDVIKLNSQLLFRIKLCTKPIFWIFHILKINRIMPFCNLFIGQPSYFKPYNIKLQLNCGSSKIIAVNEAYVTSEVLLTRMTCLSVMTWLLTSAVDDVFNSTRITKWAQTHNQTFLTIYQTCVITAVTTRRWRNAQTKLCWLPNDSSKQFYSLM